VSTPLLAEVLRHSSGANSRIHGQTHWAGVAAAGYTLCKMTLEADAAVVLLFALFHDSMRENDGRDPDHGQRAATLAHKLRDEGTFTLSDERMDVLERALIAHDRGQVSEDPTIGACWDSDRLTLWRLNRQPDARLLSTRAAKALTEPLASQQYGLLRYEWLALFLNYDILTDGAVSADMGGSPYERAPGESVYLRFGDLPEGGRSCLLAGMGREFGVSAYAGTRSEAGDATVVLDFRRAVLGIDTRYLASLLWKARPLYIVEGQHVGFGGMGEPVLADARIVEEVPAASAGVLPSRTRYKALIEAWRLKREGRDPSPDAFAGKPEPDERPYAPLAAGGLGEAVDEALDEGVRVYKALLKKWGVEETHEQSRASPSFATPARKKDPWQHTSWNQSPWNQKF
jgi:uncharacterized protein